MYKFRKSKDSSDATMKVFDELAEQERVALFVHCILHLPVDSKEIKWEDKPDDMCWNKAALILFCAELDIQAGYFEAYRDYYPRGSSVDGIPDLGVVFSDLLNQSGLNTINTVIKLCVFLLTHGLYDARGRTWIRNIVRSLQLSSHDLVSLERTLCHALCSIGDNIARKQKDEKKHDYKRYAKIGVASLGAGAVIAITGGLAAPAVAAALLVMGGTTAAAAATFTTATVMASLFGTAGAGLTGYKMMRRTRGIEEFEFEQYNDNFGDKRKLAVVIMVSGWMIDEDDYRKTFGVIPDEMSLEERLRRFYELHCPMRLPGATSEAQMWKDDEHTLLDQMTDLYGIDPRVSANLCQSPFVPSPLAPDSEEFLRHIIATVLSRAEEEGNVAVPESVPPPAVVEVSSAHLRSVPPDTSLDEVCHGVAQLTSSGESAGESAGECKGEDDGSGEKGEGEVEEALADDTEERMKNNFWSWNELEISAVMELNLLRWETEIQMELGKSLLNLLKSLRDAVAEKVLAATVLAALLSAVFVPYTLIKLTDVIDNTWTIAVERADEAGRELAHALLQRPQGSRSVTLVGHSVGARLIFSCLKELSRCKKIHTDRQLSSERDDRDLSSTGGFISMRKMSTMATGWMKSSKDTSDRKRNGSVAASAPEATGLSNSEAAGTEHVRSATVGEVSPQDLEEWDEREAIEESYRYAADIVQDVVLLGTPVGTDVESWRQARSVVSGRLINGYSSHDLILTLLYRYEKWAVHVAGVASVDVAGIENVDFGYIVKKHTDYSLNMKHILESLDLTQSAPFDNPS